MRDLPLTPTNQRTYITADDVNGWSSLSMAGVEGHLSASSLSYLPASIPDNLANLISTSMLKPAFSLLYRLKKNLSILTTHTTMLVA
jgi:hypothetical protein